MSGDDRGTGEGLLPSEDPRSALARPTPASSAGLPGQERLRILIANSHEEVLEHVARVVADLGHHLAGRETDISVVGARTTELGPDVALVALSDESMRSSDEATHALELISEIVHEARCPVVALIETENPEFIVRAVSAGISAYACPIRQDQVMGAVDVALGRFLEHRNLEEAFQRRAVIERAKGILMERDLIDEQEAFERLRSHARSSSQRLIDLAEAVLRGHRVLGERSGRRTTDRRAAGARERSE